MHENMHVRINARVDTCVYVCVHRLILPQGICLGLAQSGLNPPRGHPACYGKKTLVQGIILPPPAYPQHTSPPEQARAYWCCCRVCRGLS